MKVAVIGNDAYLARNLQNVFISDDVMSFPRLDYVDKEEIKRFDAVINFTIQPEFSCKTLSQDELLDVKLAPDDKRFGDKTGNDFFPQSLRFPEFG